MPTMKKPNVLPASVAAREKGCTTQTIYNAVERGDLHEVRMGRHRLIIRDASYRKYQVQETGRRVNRRDENEPSED